MERRLCSLIVLLIALTLILSGSAMAQETRSPSPPKARPDCLDSPYGGPCQMADDLWVMPETSRRPLAPQHVVPQATGGPDEFGYTWDDAVPVNWLDATGGTDTGMSGYSRQRVGPIPLPFPFKFYENTYTQIYIGASGYVSFVDEGYWPWQGRIPSPRFPNNVIAPYWTPLLLADSGLAGRVYYAAGGAAPNRYFVVEWYQVAFDDETYTFEVVLFENGDIVFQYQTMSYSGSYFCGAAGIEDAWGVDGLAYVGFCQQAPSNKAVRFYRPAPAARVSTWPRNQGRFSRAGATESFQVAVRNTGELGADTYDLRIYSDWWVRLYRADGTTPLTDSDGDGLVDTGPVAPGATFTITVKITTPIWAAIGDDNRASIFVYSSRDTGKRQEITLQTAVPAPFVQAYEDYADAAPSLQLVQPAGQAVRKLTPDWTYGSDMAVVEAPNGHFIFAWTQGRRLNAAGNLYGVEIWYAILDRYGHPTRGPARLTDHSGAQTSTYDYTPALSVTPDGRIGVLWARELWDAGTSRSNYNLWFAVLDFAGNLLYGPANLTNNGVWGTSQDLNVPWFAYPRLAATDDNRFILAWQREHRESGGWVDDIWYAVRSSAGAEIRAATRLTNDSPGGSGHIQPALAALAADTDGMAQSRETRMHHDLPSAPLAGGRAFLSWVSRQEGNDDIYYAVVDSNGDLIRPATDLSVDESVVDWRNFDAVQLADGRILAVWEAWGCFPGEWVGRIRLALLDAAYNRIGTPQCLLGKAPGATSGDTAVSVAADAAGRAVLTWTDASSDVRRNLYYALMQSNGVVLTPPMIFRSGIRSSTGDQYIITGFEGYGNASYRWTPRAEVDGAAGFSAALFSGSPGGGAAVGIQAANYGAGKATHVALTATLGAGLTYLGDTSGIVPEIKANQVSWRLPDLGLFDEHSFIAYIGVPAGATYGTRYPITLTLASDGPEVNPADNTATAQVMATRQVFLPLVLRSY